MKNIPTEESIQQMVTRHMKRMGTHDVSFNRLIKMYARTLRQYYLLDKEWEEQCYRTYIISGESSVKKNPIMDQINTLRKDIMALSDRLMLNPKTMANDLLKNKEDNSENPLLDFLSKNGA